MKQKLHRNLPCLEVVANEKPCVCCFLSCVCHVSLPHFLSYKAKYQQGRHFVDESIQRVSKQSSRPQALALRTVSVSSGVMPWQTVSFGLNIAFELMLETFIVQRMPLIPAHGLSNLSSCAYLTCNPLHLFSPHLLG